MQSSLGCPECANDIAKQKQEEVQIAAKKAKEGKRLFATKGAIERFRLEHPTFTDEYISQIVENTYPNKFENTLDVAIEIIKELYRSQTDLTDKTFTGLLKEWTEKGNLNSYEIETRKQWQSIENRRSLLNRIYVDARTRTVYLSQYEEYQDEGVRKYYEERCRDKGRTLAKQLFYDLNQMALDKAGQLSGYILPFHCYSESNGDVVFTKNKRTKADYDAKGNSIVSEVDVVNRNGKSSRNGCLGVFVGIILFMTCVSSFFSCGNNNKVGPFVEDKAYCRENTDSILAHMHGITVIDSFYNEENYYNTRDREGKEQHFYRYVKVTRVTNGKDTLVIFADESHTDYGYGDIKDKEMWTGQVHGHNLILEDNVDRIREHNLLMKSLFSKDTCFTLEVDNNKILHAIFKKYKPEKSERPIEDYGLNENDL